MPDASAFVYRCSRDAHAQITQLSDFISPTIVAMWNLRWQVRGFVVAYPATKQSEIVARFGLGSSLKSNELKRAFIENTWEEQQFRFSSILLTNSISIYEDFAEQLAGISLTGDAKRRAYKDLQYPSSGGKGYPRAYAALDTPEPTLTHVFYVASALSRWYSGPQLQNLLLCFRFFKEIRNSLIHNGGRVSADLVQAYNDFAPVATPGHLSVKQVPEHTPPIAGQRVELSLRGVYGFSDIILRLIATHDGNLSEAKGALQDVDRHLGRITGAARSHVEPEKREKRIAGLFRQSGLPPAVQTPALLSFLLRTDRIPSYWVPSP